MLLCIFLLKLKEEQMNENENKMKKQKEQRPFEKIIEEAMKDEYWLELIIMRTGLPLQKRKQEIAEIFKRHVILMGKETEIYSVKEAKNYFANYTRKGTTTHKELIGELRVASRHGQVSMRAASRCTQVTMQIGYEDVNPITGERSYCGIRIPPEAPPRPNENAVWNKDKWEL